MMKLTINSAVIGSVISFKQEQKQLGEGSNVRWSLQLKNTGAGAKTRQQLVDTLAGLAGQNLDAQVNLDGQTIAELTIAASQNGPRILSVSKTDAGDVHSEATVNLNLKARLPNSHNAVQSVVTLATVRTAAGISSLEQTVKVVLKRGENLDDFVPVHTPNIPSGYQRIEHRVKKDTSEPKFEVQTLDQQVFHNLPPNVDAGHYTVSTERSSGGSILRIKGFFVGEGAKAHALQLRPAGCITETMTEDAFTRRVDFDFKAPAVGTTQISESLTFSTTHRIIDHAVLGNFPAVRQRIGQPYTEVIQEGTATDNSAYPDPTPPMFPNDLIENRISYPPVGAGDLLATKWFYRFRSMAQLPAQAPEKP